MEEEEEYYLSEEDELEVIEFKEVTENIPIDKNDENLEEFINVDILESDVVCKFTSHKESVFCCCVSPLNSEFAVSGGEDEKVFLWNINSGDVILEINGYSDSVVCVSFNHNGSLIATGDMTGGIKIWNVISQKEILQLETSELKWLQWHPFSNVLLVGTSLGLFLFKIPEGTYKTFPGVAGFVSEVGQFLPNGKEAIVGCSNGDIYIVDLKSAIIIHEIKNDNAMPINVLSCNQNGALCIAGGSKPSVIVINTYSCKKINTLICGDNSEDSIESISFSDIGHLLFVAIGSLHGLLTIWDCRNFMLRNKISNSSGITKLLWDSRNLIIYTAGIDGAVRSFDGRNGSTLKEWYVHSDTILDMSLNNYFLVTSSDDKTCVVLNTERIMTETDNGKKNFNSFS